ncbi:protein BCAP-like [Esox lucius]|uniref:protein BCAP-like n=1 Tax=Esox lucius TaxID=8010 RepID=UPI001476B1E5|nr:protein BCAP-like [Esox lucius]
MTQWIKSLSTCPSVLLRQENKSSQLTLQQKLRLSEQKLIEFERQLFPQPGTLVLPKRKVEFLQDSNWKSEERVKSLEQTLSSSKEKVSLLQESLTSSEERAQTMQQNFKSSEENLQWMQHLLKTANEKSKALKEALRSSREKSETLREALGISESQIRAARAKPQSMEKSKEEQEDQIKSLMQTLRVSEERHNSMVQDLGGAASTQTEQSYKQISFTELELHSQTVALNTQLLEQRSKKSKKLERSSRYQKELEDTIKDLRKKLNIQIEKGEFALNSLRMCQKDLTDVHRHLQGSNSSFTIDDQYTMVASLGYFQSKPLQKEEGNDSHKNIEEALRSGTSCIPLSPSAMPKRNLSTRPAAPYPYRHNLGQEKYLGSSSLQCLKNSDSIQHLLTVQKRLTNLQSVEFQSNIKGLLRMS